MDKTNLNFLWSSLLINQIIKRKIKNFFLSPGYRCVPLHTIVHETNKISVEVIHDERSASYHALGSAIGNQKPSVLICTSGTAVANYFPAIIEAFHKKVPLLIITADRPFDAQGVNANQSINQVGIYGQFIKHALNLPSPTLNIGLSHLRAKIEYALNQLETHQRPVHINFPFKEPLEERESIIPQDYLKNFNSEKNYALAPLAPRVPNASQIEKIKSLFKNSKRPLVIVGEIGPKEDLNLILKFIKNLKCPFFMDITTSLKYQITQNESIQYLDHPLIVNFIENDYCPDLILHFGGRTVSNNYYRMLDRNQFDQIQVIPSDTNDDPVSRVIYKIPIKIDTFCSIPLPQLKCAEASLIALQRIQEDIKKILKNNHELNHPSIVRELKDHLKDSDTLYLGNSFPIRAFDQYAFYEKPLRSQIVTHRGVSGIEGFVSAARGYHLATKRRVFLVLGDISFIHDFSSLLSFQGNENVKIIIINNQRGGIFSTLPIKNYPRSFNSFIESPHKLEFSKILKNYPLKILMSNSLPQFRQDMKDSLESEGPSLIEVRIDHDKDNQFLEKIKKSGK